MKNTIYLFVFLLSLTFSSCGSGDYSTSADTGSASFGLKFEEASVPSAVKLAQSAARSATDICSSYGIEYISGTVYNSSNSAVATGGPWACSDHQGTINNIPAGSNLRIAIQGTVSGSVVWQGETTGVTIYADQDTNVGSITMTYTGSDTTAPTVTFSTPNGANAPVTSPITVTFSETMAASTINTSTFTINGVTGTVTYSDKTATFTPYTNLAYWQAYTGTITTDVTDMAGNHMQSPYTLSFTTEAAPSSVPSAPTGVNATAADKQVTISWTAVSGANSYNIYWSNTAGVTKTNGTQITGATSPYIQSALTNGTTYYYVVTAVNSYGESGESSQAYATPQIPTPSVPTDVSASAGDSETTISWSTVSGATSYKVYWSTTSGAGMGGTAIAVGDVTSYIHTSLTSGTSYYYVVTAVNGGGESTASSQVSAIPQATGTAPSAPTGVAVTAGNAQATITWNSVSGATSYNIYWSTTSGVTKSSGTMISNASGPYIHTGLTNGTTYYYVVTAVNGYGESGESQEASAKPIVPYWVGVKQLGTSFSDVANCVATDSYGNVYIAGYTFGGLDGNTNAGASDIVLVKYDASGNKQWTRQIGLDQAGTDSASSIAIDGNNNVYITGQGWGNLDGNISAGGSEIFIIKYDTDGNKQWSRLLGSTSDDTGTGLALDITGNVYVTGYTLGWLDGNINSGSFDVFLVKYDLSGAKLWTRQFGTSGQDTANGVVVDAGGNVYVTGSTYGGLDGNTNAGASDIFIIKYDVNGTKQWTKELGTTTDETAFAIAVDTVGDIYITGCTWGGLDGNTNSGDYDLFIVKYDSNGTQQWIRQIGTVYSDIAYSLAIDNSGNVYVTGSTSGGLDGNTNEGGSDLFILKYNSTGVKQWATQLGTVSNDYSKSIAIDVNTNIYIAGSTKGGLDGSSNAGDFDIFIAKYNYMGTKQ